MSLPRWLARFNRRVINPAAVRGSRWAILDHVGRNTGLPRRTPLDAFEVPGGYMFLVNYGRRSDWVQNTMASGRATLTLCGERMELTNPRLINREEARSLMQPGSKDAPAWMGIDEYLLFDAVGS